MKDIGPRKWWAMGAIALAAIAFSLDLTVLNLALPTLSKALHATTSNLQWIADAYALVLAVLTLPAGLLGDRFGRKKLMIFALGVFGAASLLCAYSTSVAMLICARLLLGVGAAFILPLGMSVVPVYFSEKERTKALAALMGGVFLAYPLGPILGGWLLTHYWWGSVFLINLPVVAVAMIAIAAFLPESKSSEQHRIDIVGIGLSSIGLTGITYGAIEAETVGWNNGRVVSALIVGAVLLALFAVWEKRQVRRKKLPLVDTRLFGSAGFTWGTLLMTSVNFSLFGLLFGLPQYLQAVRGYNALHAGYYLLPMIGGLMIGSVASSKFAQAVGTKIAATVGFAIMATGLLLGAGTTLASSGSFIITWTAVIGLGLGFAMPTVADAALSALSAERSASGTALISAVRQVGGTLGIALLGTALGASYRSHLHLAGLPSQVAEPIRGGVNAGVAIAQKINSPALLTNIRTAFVHGQSVMLWVCSGIAASAVILALLFLPNIRERKNSAKEL
ncbi:MAG TPA: MFS transporter [Candidatus Saccharimonadales bacterium]